MLTILERRRQNRTSSFFVHCCVPLSMKAESGKHCKIQASLKRALLCIIFLVKGCWISLEGNQCKRHHIYRIQAWQHKKKEDLGLLQNWPENKNVKGPPEAPTAWFFRKYPLTVATWTIVLYYHRITRKNCHSGSMHGLKLCFRFTIRKYTRALRKKMCELSEDIQHPAHMHVCTHVHRW